MWEVHLVPITEMFLTLLVFEPFKQDTAVHLSTQSLNPTNLSS